MKKITTFLFFMQVLQSAPAQWGMINSMTVIPSNPTTVDTIKLIAYSTVGYTDCPLAGDTITNLSPGNYLLEAYYCMGGWTSICNPTDTFNLGVLPAGTNNLYMTLYSAQGIPPPCQVYSPLDTDTVQIFVSAPTGIPVDEIIPLLIVPADGGFVIKGAERIQGDKNFALYSITGRMVFNKTLSEGENKIVPMLRPGIYFYRLRVGKDFYYGKLFSD